MDESYVILNDEVLTHLLIGKQVRYFSHDTGLDKAILVGIVDFNKKAFCFRKRGELHHNAPYIIEGADILIGDWDWTDVFKLSIDMLGLKSYQSHNIMNTLQAAVEQ